MYVPTWLFGSGVDRFVHAYLHIRLRIMSYTYSSTDTFTDIFTAPPSQSEREVVTENTMVQISCTPLFRMYKKFVSISKIIETCHVFPWSWELID